MAFDYCTAADAFAYGNSAGNATDPVNEMAVMSRIVTAVSRAVDKYCEQSFSYDVYIDKRLRGVVDVDGTLLVYPPVPIIETITSAAYRAPGSATWSSLSVADVDIHNKYSGAVVRFVGTFHALRYKPVAVRMSYAGGYKQVSDLPTDLVWATTALAWFTFQRRSAPMDTTAMPELGIVVRPGAWPEDIRMMLNRFKKVTPA